MKLPRPGFDAAGFQRVWDVTSLTSYMKCPARYNYEIREGWRLPPGVDGDHHLVFGKLLHGTWEEIKLRLADCIDRDTALLCGLQWLLREAWQEGVTWECCSCGKPLGEAAVGSQPDWSTGSCPKCGCLFSENPPDAKPWGHYWDSDDKHKNFRNLFRTIIWGFEDLKHVDPPAVLDGKPAVEIGIERPFTTSDFETYTLRAKMDEVVTDGWAQWVVEKKTTKTTLSPAYWRRFSPNVQTTHQTWLAKTSGKLPQALGVIVEAHQVLVGSSRFERQHIHVSPERVMEWEQTLDFWLTQAHNNHAAEKWPMNEAACNLDGGCPFRRVCEKPPSLRQGFLESNYERHFWNPVLGEVMEGRDEN